MAREARKPDYTVNALEKDLNIKGRVGAAWKQEDGSIQITLDPWVILKGRGHNMNLLVTLFPAMSKEDWEERNKRKEPVRAAPKSTPEEFEDDIPF